MPNRLPDKPGIYIITNSVSGRRYVGSGVNLRKRWNGHRWSLNRGKHHNPRLQSAWTKHGESAFTIDVLEVVEDASHLLTREQYWLDHYDAAACPGFYNFCAVAGSQLGRVRSKATCLRLSAAHRGRTHSPESRAKMRQAKLGRKLSPEHVEKVRLKSLGRRYVRSESFKATRKLVPDQVREFRRLRAAGWSLHQLRRHFNISLSSTQRIAAGDSYVGVARDDDKRNPRVEVEVRPFVRREPVGGRR